MTLGIDDVNIGEECKLGGTCKFVHPFEKAGSGLCFTCGSTEHSSAECKRAKKGPTKGNSSDKGSRPNSDDRGRSP
eukprot:206525-Amphidinium_carterae.3